MKSAPFKAFIFFLLAAACMFSVQARGIEASDDTRDAQVWLKKIQSAATRLNYSGTFVYQQSNQMRASRITHLWDGKNETEKLEILDGKPREYIRHNEDITCYVPEAKTILVEKRLTQDVFPAILAASPAELAEHYTLKKAESGRVAEFDCQVLALEPKDNLRYGYRLWAEKSSGLLLRAQTLGENGNVIEQIAFTQVFIGDLDKNRLKPDFGNLGAWRVENAVTSPSSLSGWSVKAMPAGFKKTHELKRLVLDSAAPASNAVDASQREISQIVYSDGLAAISVFIEPVTQRRSEGSIRQGAMNIMAKRQGDFWITVVGEVPAAAVKQVINSIEFNLK